MESVLIGRSSCPACGYPVKYRWMGHGQEDLMVNLDGTPHKDSCPAANFREVRKRVMKMPRTYKYKGPQLCAPAITPPAPGESASSILERLLATPLQQPAEQAIAETSAANEQNVAQDVAQNVDKDSQRLLNGQAADSAGHESAENPPRRRRGRPRKGEVVVRHHRPRVAKSGAERQAAPKPAPAPEPAPAPAAISEPATIKENKPAPVKEKPKPPEIERARCPECNAPLITNLNTGLQMCLTCGREAPAPVPSFPDEG